MQYLDVFARCALGVVFAIAVAGKVSGREAFRSFARSLADMRILPARLITPVAAASAVVEALVIVLVAIPLRWAGQAAFAVAVGVLVALTAAIVLSLRNGNRAPCRCFGASRTPLGMRHVVRNALLLVVAILGLVGAYTAGGFTVPATIVAAVAGAVAGVTMTAYDDLAELVRPAR